VHEANDPALTGVKINLRKKKGAAGAQSKAATEEKNHSRSMPISFAHAWASAFRRWIGSRYLFHRRSRQVRCRIRRRDESAKRRSCSAIRWQLAQVSHTAHPRFGEHRCSSTCSPRLRPSHPTAVLLLTNSYRMHRRLRISFPNCCTKGAALGARREHQHVASPGLSGTGLRYLPSTCRQRPTIGRGGRTHRPRDRLVTAGHRARSPRRVAPVEACRHHRRYAVQRASAAGSPRLDAAGFGGVEAGTVVNSRDARAFCVFFSTGRVERRRSPRGIGSSSIGTLQRCDLASPGARRDGRVARTARPTRGNALRSQSRQRVCRFLEQSTPALDSAASFPQRGEIRRVHAPLARRWLLFGSRRWSP